MHVTQLIEEELVIILLPMCFMPATPQFSVGFIKPVHCCCRSVHHSALELAEPVTPDHPQGSGMGAQIRAFLSGLFRHLCTGAGFGPCSMHVH